MPLLLALAALSLICGCAERQDANLPYGGNALAYLGRTPVRGVANDAAFANGLAYVADAPFGISIYDLADPAQPQLVDSLDLADPNLKLVAIDSTGRIAAIQASYSVYFYDLATGDFLFTAGSSGQYEVELLYDQNTLNVYRSDINPGDGFYCERYLNTGSGDSLAFGAPFFYSRYNAQQTYGFARNGADQAYVCLDLLGFVLVDYSVAVTASVVAQLNTPGRTRDAAISGNVLCLASGYEGLVTVDVSNPLNPVMLGSLAINNATDIGYVETVGNRAYLLDTNDGLFAVDISNPSSPVLIGSLLTSNPNDFCIAGDLVLIADQDMGLVVGQILY